MTSLLQTRNLVEEEGVVVVAGDEEDLQEEQVVLVVQEEVALDQQREEGVQPEAPLTVDQGMSQTNGNMICMMVLEPADEEV